MHCLGLPSVGLFQNAWEWTQTHYTMDDTIAIDYFHCGQHYKALSGHSSIVFFVKNCGWGHCLLSQKLLGLAVKPSPKHFQTEQQRWVLLPSRTQYCCVWPNQTQNTTKQDCVWLTARPTDLRVWLRSYTQGYYYLYYKYFKFYYY